MINLQRTKDLVKLVEFDFTFVGIKGFSNNLFVKLERDAARGGYMRTLDLTGTWGGLWHPLGRYSG